MDYSIIEQVIPSVVTPEDNTELIRIPSTESYDEVAPFGYLRGMSKLHFLLEGKQPCLNPLQPLTDESAFFALTYVK